MAEHSCRNNNATIHVAVPERPKRQGRIQSIDFVRGLIMFIMALDHTRAKFYTGINPVDLNETTMALFLTRWVTHICAPTFMFLSGTAFFLVLKKKNNDKRYVSFYLISRGLFLIALDLTVFNSSLNFHKIGVGVLWGLGWSMIFNAVLIYIPVRVLTILGLIVVSTHNAFEATGYEFSGFMEAVWVFLYHGGSFQVLPGCSVVIQYTPLPWAFVMSLGFCFGSMFQKDAEVRKNRLLIMGITFLILFIFIRYWNQYGDPVPWKAYSNNIFRTLISFLNCEKYPPSLLFLLMTLGQSILLLGIFNNHVFNKNNPFVVLGKVPLFYYVLHIPLIRIIYILYSMLPLPPHNNLLIVYGMWFFVVLLLLPACYWYRSYKQNNRNFLTRYI